MIFVNKIVIIYIISIIAWNVVELHFWPPKFWWDFNDQDGGGLGQWWLTGPVPW